MNESEQAQAIADIKERRKSHFTNRMEMHGLMEFVDSLYADYVTALEIVDSQAQKIAEQEKEIERLTLMCKQEDTQIVALVKQRDEARGVADDWRDKAGSKYDSHPWEKV